MPPEAVAIAFGTAIGGVLYGILSGLVFHRILGAYVEGGIGALGCALTGGIWLVITVAVLLSHSIFLFVLLGLMVALTPLFTRRAKQMEDHRYYDERIQAHIDAIRDDPRNLAARGGLAEAFHKRGYLDEAIEQYTEILRLSPSSREEAYKLKQLIQEREERRDPLVTCPSCGHKNPKSRLHCSECEANLAPRDRLKQWLEGTSYKQSVRMFGIAVGAVILILFLGGLLSPVGKFVAIAVTLIVLGIVFLVNTYMNP